MLENEIYDWLNTRQIATAQYKTFTLNEELQVDFYPVALKFLSDKVVHKSEVGAVVTAIKNKQELETAKCEILSNLCKNNIRPDEERDKLLVTKMGSGFELFFGIINDNCFEKVIAFGAGGIFVELIRVCSVIG